MAEKAGMGAIRLAKSEAVCLIFLKYSERNPDSVRLCENSVDAGCG